MIRFKRYFIVGTNDNGLHDTMNGAVTDELIMCKDCEVVSRCLMYWSNNDPYGFCKWAKRKENDNQG